MLLVTHGSTGDVLPFIGIGAALVADGHEVVLLTHAPYRRMAEAAGIEFIPIDTEAEYAQELREFHRLYDVVFRVPGAVAQHYAQTSWFDQVRREFQVIKARYRPGRTVVVARSITGVSALFAKEALGAPVAWLAISPSMPQVMPLIEYMYRYTVGDRLNALRAELGLAPVEDWAGWFALPDLTVGLWPEWFDSAGSQSPPQVHRAGFVAHDAAESGTLPEAVTRLLDAGTPPVLIAGGTSMITHDAFFATAVGACARAGRSAILVCPHRDLVPDPLPPGVHWFERLPYGDLMPRVAAVIHHGGINTIVRALTSGTPQLILAWSIDRPDNARRLRRHGLAAWLPVADWSADRLAELLDGIDGMRVEPPEPIDTEAATRQTARLLAQLVPVPTAAK